MHDNVQNEKSIKIHFQIERLLKAYISKIHKKDGLNSKD